MGELRSNLMEAIKTIAEKTVSGAIEGWRPHDQKGHAMYREALSELADLIDQQQKAAS